MHIDSVSLREVMVFLVAAGIVVPLIQRLKISPVLGFLIVGLLIGPYGLARFTDAFPWLSYVVIADLDGVRAFAELGVVFLLFMIGLELSFDRLWAMRRLVFGLGGAQVIITGTVIAVVASLFENTISAAIVLGAGFALSSTAIVMQLLAENRRLGSATGRIAFSILLCQDLAVLPILFLVSAFASQSSESPAFAFLWAIGNAIFAVTVIFFVGKMVIRPLFRAVGSTASREMFLALVLLIIIGTALATQQAGLSMALGAFLAGLLFAETEYRHEIEVDIEPFKGLLLGLFFVSVGMAIDVTQVAANPLWILASVVGLYLVKGPIIYALTRLFGEPRSVAGECALLLGQGGEFAFIVVAMAFSVGLLPRETAQFMLIVTSLTMFVTPLVASAARKIARRIEIWETGRTQAEGSLPADLSDHVIIVGYGRVGQMLGSILDSQEITHIGLDNDTKLVAKYRAADAGVFFGDASRPEMLRKFAADTAAALVVTMDSPLAAERVVAMAHHNWPELAIYARARDAEHAKRLIELGATHVIPETAEASLQLSEITLIGVGIPDEAARHVIEIRRQTEKEIVEAVRPGKMSEPESSGTDARVSPIRRR